MKSRQPEQDRDRERRHKLFGQAEQRPQIVCERNGDTSRRARLDDQQQRPAVQERHERMKRLTEESILAADFRHHRAQLGKDKCAGQRDQSARHPYCKNQKRRLDRPRDDIRVDENAGADDAADDDHRRVEEVEFAGEFHNLSTAIFMGMNSHRRPPQATAGHNDFSVLCGALCG
jgi:hypothetical protein